MPVDVEFVELNEKEFLAKVKEVENIQYQVDAEKNLWLWSENARTKECFAFQIPHDTIKQYLISFMGKEATPEASRMLDEMMNQDNGVNKIGAILLRPMKDRACGGNSGK